MSREKNFTIEDISNMWEDYKKEVDQNPDIIDKATARGVMQEKVRRPYLQSGFYAYVYRNHKHHVYQYFENVNNDYDEFLGIVTHIKNEWRTDQIGGTMSGMYKSPNLTARINGLSDKTEANVKVEQPLFPKQDKN